MKWRGCKRIQSRPWLHLIVACARLSDSIVLTYWNEQSENKTRATWERGRWRREKCLSPAPACFSHFFLLNDFSPLSRSLEQARFRWGLGLKKTWKKGELGARFRLRDQFYNRFFRNWFPGDWLKTLPPLFEPIRRKKSKNNPRVLINLVPDSVC